jgi:DNA-binding transcriptional regulator YhcF (GntR family)
MNNGAQPLRFSPVSPSAPGPLYEQLVANVKREIRARRLAADEPLPSTRALAADLRVSVITIARAYEELEKEGIVYSRQGQRTFVAHDALEKLHLEESAPWDHLCAAVDVARKVNMSDDELIKLLHAALAQRDKR